MLIQCYLIFEHLRGGLILSICVDKEEMRKDMLSKRISLKRPESEELSDIIINRIVESDYYRRSKIVMTYVDINNEVITRDFINLCLNDNKRVAVPFIKKDGTGKKVIASEIFSTEELKTGEYGILAPVKDNVREINPEIFDIVIVPGVVFDENMNRIGYGGGYYDVFLKNLNPQCKKIAIAYDFQIKKEIPHYTHDISMDLIFTESRIIKKIF